MILVDGNNMYIRFYSQLGNLVVGGRQVGGLFGFIRGIFYLIKKYDDDNVIVVWDGKNSRMRRQVLYNDYKRNRVATFKDPNIWQLKGELQEILSSCIGITQVHAEDYEADDVIANFAKYTDENVIIISSDKDLWQLIDERVKIHTKGGLFDLSKFKKETGCASTEEYLLCRALAGDTSDNIKGVKGIGHKRALKLIKAGDIDKYKDIVERNLVLMRLDGKVDGKILIQGERNLGKFMQLCVEKYQFKSLAELATEIFDRI